MPAPPPPSDCQRAGLSDPVPIKRGTIQGDSLNPLLFLLYLEPLLQWLDAANGRCGYLPGCTRTPAPLTRRAFSPSIPAPDRATASAYADDLAIFAGTVDDMCSSLDKVERYCAWAHIRVNPRKCAFTGREFHPRPDSQCTLAQEASRRIRLGGEPLPFLKPDEPYKYLGVYLSLDLNPTANFTALRDKMLSRLSCIDRAPLLPWDRRRVIHSLVLSLIDYHFPVGLLRESQVADLQALVLPHLRDTFGLRHLRRRVRRQLRYSPLKPSAASVFLISLAYRLTATAPLLTSLLMTPAASGASRVPFLLANCTHMASTPPFLSGHSRSRVTYHSLWLRRIVRIHLSGGTPHGIPSALPYRPLEPAAGRFDAPEDLPHPLTSLSTVCAELSAALLPAPPPAPDTDTSLLFPPASALHSARRQARAARVATAKVYASVRALHDADIRYLDQLICSRWRGRIISPAEFAELYPTAPAAARAAHAYLVTHSSSVAGLFSRVEQWLAAPPSQPHSDRPLPASFYPTAAATSPPLHQARALFPELTSVHACRLNSDGKREYLCSWAGPGWARLCDVRSPELSPLLADPSPQPSPNGSHPHGLPYRVEWLDHWCVSSPWLESLRAIVDFNRSFEFDPPALGHSLPPATPPAPPFGSSALTISLQEINPDFDVRASGHAQMFRLSSPD